MGEVKGGGTSRRRDRGRVSRKREGRRGEWKEGRRKGAVPLSTSRGLY